MPILSFETVKGVSELVILRLVVYPLSGFIFNRKKKATSLEIAF